MSIEVINEVYLDDTGTTKFSEEFAYSAGVQLDEYRPSSGTSCNGNDTAESMRPVQPTFHLLHGAVWGAILIWPRISTAPPPPTPDRIVVNAGLNYEFRLGNGSYIARLKFCNLLDDQKGESFINYTDP